ncbi:MAG: DNA primase [Acidobacteriota bacterium]|nr:DNA primase [Acidobacteriota bacterium]
MAFGHIQLTDELVQSVRDTIDIVDIASDHTRLTKAGRRYKGLCPLHKEKTPSFSVDPDHGLFYCFGCSQGGDAIRLHMLTSGDDFPAAIESLARRYNIPLPKVSAGARGAHAEQDLEPVLAAALDYYRRQLAAQAAPRAYLERRRIPPELIDRFGLGYAPPGWQNLINALKNRHPERLLERAGLIAESRKRPGERYDRFRERLIFPIRNTAGRLVGFGGRTLGDDEVKYINTSETSSFRKGQLLYGLDQAKRAIRESRRAFMVEGYFDVIGSAAAGIDNVVATMGTALTVEQARLIARFADEVVVGYDGDSAGEQAYRRSIPILLGAGLGVLRARPGDGADPDSVRLERGADELRRLLAEAPDAIVLEIERLSPDGVEKEPRRQSQGAKAIVELLTAVPDSVLRYGYARQAAARLGIPEELLLERLRGRRGEKPQETREQSEGLVRSLEEKTLQLLLAEGSELPQTADLPPEDAFLDPACRNIYRAFRALHEDGRKNPPAARELLARLPDQGPAVDRMARLLLEVTTGSDPRELQVSVRQLERRWRQQRSRELAAQITKAQRAGDQKRLEQLLTEKAALSRRLHERSDEPAH